MRAQTIAHKKRLAKRKAQRVGREKPHHFLMRGDPVRTVSGRTGVSLSIVYSIKKALTEKDTKRLEKLLDPESHFAGRRPILSSAEESLVVSRILEAAERGFAVDFALMKSVQGQIAQDGRNSFSNGVPSSDAIRSFRARHMELTFRASEQVSSARLAAQNPTHIGTLKGVIQKLQKKYPGLFSDPRKIWNWETQRSVASMDKRTLVLPHRQVTRAERKGE